jgi:hypothetical protein
MPYGTALATRSITVSAPVRSFVDVKVSPSPPWRAGQTLRIEGRLLEDTTPLVGVEVWAAVQFDTSVLYLTYYYSGPDGKVILDFTVPYQVACRSAGFFLEDDIGTQSDRVWGKVAYPTRLSISAPDTVKMNEKFKVTGKLEYERSPGDWVGLGPGRKVEVYYNTSKLGEATTASDGSYSVEVSIPATGTYTLKAYYAGEGFGYTPTLARLARPLYAAARLPAAPRVVRRIPQPRRLI